MNVRLKTSARPGQFVAFVDLDGRGETRARFRRSDRVNQWHCDDCGTHRFSTCPHERAALTAWRNRKERP